jgi:hypothetical protein
MMSISGPHVRSLLFLALQILQAEGLLLTPLHQVSTFVSGIVREERQPQ